MAPPAKDIILVVDDEAMVLRMVTTALAFANYRVIVAENGVAGWEAFLRLGDEIALVLADVIMPAMSGPDMAEKILALDPHARILLMTGYTDDVIRPQNARNFPLVRKPFLPDELVRRIREELEK